MHTAKPGSKLAYICENLIAMKPGECVKMDRRALADIDEYNHNGSTFTAPDRILGNIAGSAWTHSFRVDPSNGDVTFERHEDTGEIHYRSPDRR